jgi:hypothetical protein
MIPTFPKEIVKAFESLQSLLKFYLTPFETPITLNLKTSPL